MIKNRTEYCMDLIWQAINISNNNRINRIPNKIKILIKMSMLKNKYNLTIEDIYQDMCYDFLSRDIENKIDLNRGSHTTFILKYVNRYLINKIRILKENVDIMNQENTMSIEDLLRPDFPDMDDPESLMIVQETISEFRDKYGDIVDIILGESDMTLQELADKENTTYAAIQQKAWRIKNEMASEINS